MNPKKPKKTRSGPSGKHQSPRRILSGTLEQWGAWAEAVKIAGKSWAQWARDLMDREAHK